MKVFTAKAQSTPIGTPVERDHALYSPLYMSTTLRDVEFEIEELETITLRRLRVLKAVAEAHEHAAQNGWRRDEMVKARNVARAAERQHELFVEAGDAKRPRQKKVQQDEASHFILRLALCGDHDSRFWLLNAEVALFAARVEGATPEQLLYLLRSCGGPSVIAVSNAELEKDRGRLKEDLDRVMRGSRFEREGAHNVDFFRVAFEHVPALVRSRRCLVRDGNAYIPKSSMQDVVHTFFRARLSEALTRASSVREKADRDQRMGPILKSVCKHYNSQKAKELFDGAEKTDKISLSQLNDSLPAMPLCMQNMMGRLRDQHHLRHAARMQLGVFLMHCGLTMDESLRFWRTEFGRGSIDSSKFEKTYSYNIRHYYGKEGKRQQLRARDCMKVINERPGPGEYNGCPYRELQEPALTAAIRRLGVDGDNAKHIAAKAKEGHFQIACGMCFNATQPPPEQVDPSASSVTSHPNSYFIEARRRRIAQRKAIRPADVDKSDEDMPMTNPDESQTETQPTPTKPPIVSDAGSVNPSSVNPSSVEPDPAVIQSMDVQNSTPPTENSAELEERDNKRLCTEPKPSS